MVQVKLQITADYLPDLIQRMVKYRISQNALAREMKKSASQVNRWFTSNKERRVMPEMNTVIQIEQAVETLRRRNAARPGW
jgi:hypothetical protein